ncbi:MAG: integrase family protein [Herbinix sp.]|jgi:integrase|nr:integrase family protein [Herbinix sp.]
MCNIDSYWSRFYEGTSIIRVTLDKLDYITLDKWAHDMVNQNQLTAKQYGNMTLIMRQVLDYAVDKELIPKSQFSRVKVESRRFEHTKKKEAVKEVFLLDEQPIIVEEALKDSELTGTSLPLSIPLSFQMEVENRLQLDDGRWKCNGYKVVEHTKTKAGNRKVILIAAAKELIEKAKALNEANGFYDDDFIFVNEKGRVHFKAIDSRVKKYCRKAGIPEKSIHKIRKTYISTLIDANLNIDQIRRLVGHENEQTTYQNYCFNRLNETQTIDLVRKHCHYKM